MVRNVLTVREREKLSTKLFQEMRIDRVTGCIIAVGSRMGDYLATCACGLNMYSHRLSVLLCHDSTIEDVVVRHLCHNKHCINPAHLTTGTYRDNMLDSVRDGGVGSWLNSEQVTQILRIYTTTGRTVSDVADYLQLSRVIVKRVISGECYYAVDVDTALRDAASVKYKRECTRRGLTDAEVLCVRSLYCQKHFNGTELAKRYGVSTVTINRAINGKYDYRHLRPTTDDELRITDAKRFFHANRLTRKVR